MDVGSMMLMPWADGESAKTDLAACNARGERYGLVLTEEQMGGLARRRVDALRATGRVEFGRGVLLELVSAFCDSPYLSQEAYEETLAELQDAFYRLKEESNEQLPDQELIDAMRYAFDNEAHGSTDYVGDMPASRLVAIAAKLRGDESEDWSETEAYEKNEGEDDAEEKTARDELDRVYEGGRCDRPDEAYAAGFYDAYNELYRIGFDSNSRIGGSSLR